MPGTRTALETTELLLRAVTGPNRDDLADLYAPDAAITNRFAPDNVPATTRGNEELRGRMKVMAELVTYDAVEDVRIHQTQDPEVVVAEFTVLGHVIADGSTFRLPFVNVMRIVDGLVQDSRDYGDAVRARELFERIQPKLD